MIQAANAIMGMNWAMAKSHGMRQSPESLRYGAQALSVVLTLVHYAHALGIRRGRAEGQ
ncbi:MAG: hypothetical protein JW900_14255 [Anaerolineae bacterium]|nr:hypothetical protein [Anaerolineae bacterium]